MNNDCGTRDEAAREKMNPPQCLECIVNPECVGRTMNSDRGTRDP
jgi:hypothetical protein